MRQMNDDSQKFSFQCPYNQGTRITLNAFGKRISHKQHQQGMIDLMLEI